MFVDQRIADSHRRQSIAEFVEGLNRRLRNGKAARRLESVSAEAVGRIAQDNLIDVYGVHFETVAEKDGGREHQ